MKNSTKISYRPAHRPAISRRAALAGLGMGAAAQFLPTLRNAHAQTPIPKRLVIFYSQHGTLPWLWQPTGSGANYQLGPMLAPLRGWEKDLILLNGIDSKALHLAGGMTGACGHSTGQMGSLTANRQLGQKTAAGPSIDQYIVEELKKANGGVSPTKFPSLQIGAGDWPANLSLFGQPFLGWSAASQKTLPLPIVFDPYTMHRKLFPDGMAPTTGGTSTPDPNIVKRKNVLDYVSKEFGTVANTLGRYEHDRLVDHATRVSDLKNRLQAGGGVITGGMPRAGCVVAPATGFPTNMGQSGWWDNTRVYMPRIMQMALACDMTRVLGFQLETPADSAFGYTAGAQGTSDLHDLVHKLDVSQKEGNDQARLTIAKNFYLEGAKLYASILQSLADIKEADGSRLLDHTAVLWAGEIAQPGHSNCNYKWVLGGSCGGYFKTGQALNWDDDSVRWDVRSQNPSNGDLFVTLANAMGIQTNTFGDSSTTTGPIAALKV